MLIKLPSINDLLVHFDSLVEQGGIALLNGIPITGYACIFSEGQCLHIAKYKNGILCGNYGVEYLEKIIPYFSFTDSIIVDAECLEYVGGDSTDFNCARFKDKLFTGISIEFSSGFFETIIKFDNGDNGDVGSWNKKGIHTFFNIWLPEYTYEYEIGVNGKNSLFSYSSNNAFLSISYFENLLNNGAGIDNPCTEIYIREDAFLYAAGFNDAIGLGEVLSKKMLYDIPLVEHLKLVGEGFTEEIISLLSNNPMWCNVKKITVRRFSLSESDVAKIFSAYPAISIT
jgi:hypothetical protein